MMFDRQCNLRDDMDHCPELDSPLPLKDLVLKEIAEKIDVIVFPPQFYVHRDLGECLLRLLCREGTLSDDVLLTAFQGDRTCLKRVHLDEGKGASNLSLRGLRVLRTQKLIHLSVSELTCTTVSDLIGCCLNEWTLNNLKTLNVSKSTFVDSNNKYTVVVALSKLTHLKNLNVSHTEFNGTSLELIAQDLKELECLDISCTKVSGGIGPLRKCKDRLKSLSMYGLKFPPSNDVVSVLMDLKELRHLDISEDRDDHPFDILANNGRLLITDLLNAEPHILPNLVSFDISGKDEVTPRDLKTFLSNRPSIKFIGLLLTDLCKGDIFDSNKHLFRPELVVTGYANEDQVLESLRRYSNRPQYVQKSLYHLFRLTHGLYDKPRVDIINLVLESAHNYGHVFSIQMAATACLFNLSKSDLGQKLHPRILSDIVKADMDAMEAFPQHRQLQKNVLLTICSDRVLTEVSFNKYRCARLVMDCLCAWTDNSMNRMSVAICSILAAKITTSQTSEIGSHANYMRKLLSIVKGRMEDGNIDITMKFTLSALWNLTDESPKTSAAFLSEGGMTLFVQVLESFPGDQSVETKILGLLNNIAEVKDLRSNLMVDSFINILRKLLHSTHIDVSYFAAGIVAHLASDGPQCWEGIHSITMDEMTHDLSCVVMNWKTPKDEMVAYRSFKPFFPLMEVGQKHAVQLWAVWAIHHVCTKNPQRYCTMLKDQGGDVVIHNLMKGSSCAGSPTHSSVYKLCEQVSYTMAENGFFPSDKHYSGQEQQESSSSSFGTA